MREILQCLQKEASLQKARGEASFKASEALRNCKARNGLKIGARQEATLQILRMPTFLLQKSVNNASREPKGNCGS